MINTNYEQILRYIYENATSLEQIMKGLNSSHIDSKLNTVRFIIDLCNNSKLLQIESKQLFFVQLVQPQLMSLLTEIMMYQENFPDQAHTHELISTNTAMREIVESMVDTAVGQGQKDGEEGKTTLKIEGEEWIHSEFEVNKLELLKVHVAEILTGCLQILPSKVILLYIIR